MKKALIFIIVVMTFLTETAIVSGESCIEKINKTSWKASAYGVHPGNFMATADKGIIGKFGGQSWLSPPNPAVGDWYQIYLGESVKFDTVEIYSDYVVYNYLPSAFKVMVSDDGINYKDVSDMTFTRHNKILTRSYDVSCEIVTFMFRPTTAEYLRFVLTEDRPDYMWNIADVNVWSNEKITDVIYTKNGEKVTSLSEGTVRATQYVGSKYFDGAYDYSTL